MDFTAYYSFLKVVMALKFNDGMEYSYLKIEMEYATGRSPVNY